MSFNNCLSICRHIITVCKCFLNIQYYTSNTALYTYNNTHSRKKKRLLSLFNTFSQMLKLIAACEFLRLKKAYDYYEVSIELVL